MRLKVTVDQGIARGEIAGDLDLVQGSDTQPILTIRMRNILKSVMDTIIADSI